MVNFENIAPLGTPLPGMQADLEQSVLLAPWKGLMVVYPSGARRQAHKNAFCAAIGFQSENRSPVVDQVELHISAPPDFLPFHLPFPIGNLFSFPDDRKVGLQEGLAICLLETK